jgi:hypothetical protein
MKAMYKGNERYSKLGITMDLLGIKDVSTPRQEKNGTIVWRLPIKYSTHPKFIEVASFATGYVRNQNGGYTNYQLNKRCESEPQYYPEYKWCDDKDCNVKTGKFYQYTTRSCVLIPKEIDRLEYLISYCLKNYYIKNANQVINGKYISKWEHEYQLERANSTYGQNTGAMVRIDDLESEVRELETKYQSSQAKLELRAQAVRDLEDRVYELTSQVDITWDKLVNSKDYTTDLKAQLHASQEELAATKVRQDVSVIVNGHRYKVL